MYDTNEDVLVARKSDYQNNNIGDGYFLVPKDEWFCNDDGIKRFHLYLTKFDGSRVSLCSSYSDSQRYLANHRFLQVPIKNNKNFIKTEYHD